MPQSESIAKLAAALSSAQGEFESIKKQQDNPFFKSKYADLASTLEAVQPALTKHQLAVIQSPSTDTEKKTVLVETMLLHSSGEWKSSIFEMPVSDWKAQGIGSVVTYLRRYSISAVLNLAAEDDDGNEASGRSTEQPRQSVQQPRQSSPAPRQSSKPAPRKTESDKKPEPPKPVEQPKQVEQQPVEQPKKEEPKAETPQHKLRDLLANIYKDPKANVNGASLKAFVFKGTGAEETYKNTSNTNLGALTDVEAEAAYNSLMDAWKAHTLDQLLGTESK
jgi:hypothetical protein